MFILKTRCPYCKATHDRLGGLNSDDPQDGDFSMCFYCGRWNVLVLDDQPHLRAPTKNELLEISNNADCRAALAAWLTA